jgi:hypothetical protein
VRCKEEEEDLLYAVEPPLTLFAGVETVPVPPLTADILPDDAMMRIGFYDLFTSVRMIEWMLNWMIWMKDRETCKR